MSKKSTQFNRRWLTALAAAAFMSLIALAALPSRADSTDQSAVPYVLSINDQLAITVGGHDDLTRTVTILTDGTITFPDAGMIHAAGMTVQALTTDLVHRLSQTINQPDVTVIVQGSLQQKASVLGAVKSPGAYPIIAGTKVLDLLADAGGLTSDPALTQATLIVAKNQSVVPVDVNGLLNGSNPALNLTVSPGDTLLVQAGIAQMIQVSGDVSKPGSFPAGRDGTTAASLLAQAGGALPDAALSKAQVLHDGKVTLIDLRGATTDLGSQAASTMLVPGDVLQIPAISLHIAILGDVHNPGVFPIPDGGAMSMVTAIADCGGTNPDADLKNASVLHTGEDNKQTLTTVDLGKILIGKEQDIALNPKDIIYIPSKKQGSLTAQAVASLVGPFAILSKL